MNRSEESLPHRAAQRRRLDAEMLRSLASWFGSRAKGFRGSHSFNDGDVSELLERSAELVQPGPSPVEMRDASAASSSADEMDGWRMLPEDLATHRRDFATACRIARDVAETEADRDYWRHQLKTLEEVGRLLDAREDVVPDNGGFSP